MFSYIYSNVKTSNEIRALPLKSVINETAVLRTTVITQRNTWKKRLVVARKEINRITPDPCNAKEHYQPMIKKKNKKWVKQSEKIMHQPKTFENPNIVDIK